MDSLFSSILGELAGKFLSFLIDRCTSKPLQLPPEEKIQRLERMLLRLAATVEEAEGRSITNHAMLHQINMLRQDMHRGYYVLDTVRFLKDNDEVSYSSALSTLKFAKRARITEGSRRHGDRRELEQNLQILITLASYQ
ncbi:hypothetical protein E2562_021785 [Oryza meyeriana var. granulata]|uniref:Uncharacterized protein n=1 Tax=Oryza meyeriana var. granulata TaxID=110450 RepID=A0A6G1EN66_9ORYZ|nr:hypothetical protein E2562_021785 [Oryza meyeriana var. granulata]